MKAKIWAGIVLGAVATLPLIGCGPEQADETVAEVTSALTGTWTSLVGAPAPLDTCELLTTGDVLCHEYLNNVWHRLSPDNFGSYQNGSWDFPFGGPPAMPNGNDPSFGCSNCEYAPLYFASAILRDGRMIVIGGEKNVTLTSVWTNIGFIYDPVTDSWSNQLTEAFGGGHVGDAQGIVLQDGTFVLADINNTNLEALNATTGVFTARNPTGKLDINDEEGWNILSDGTVMTVDGNLASSFEKYSPSTNTWGNGGSTPVNMADTGTGTGFSTEVGPCAGRPDNKLICFSANPFGQNALYTPSTNTWSHTTGMDFPAGPLGGHFAVADGPAAALPNGNALVMASEVTVANPWNIGSHFYELGLSNNTLTAVTDAPNAAAMIAYQGRMLVLPTGEVLLTAWDQSSIQTTAVYSNGAGPASSSRPVITSNPATIAAGGTYTTSGRLFNGFSQGATYGDDAQSATNYPLVRITNTATGHVYYARTFNFTRNGIELTGSSTSVTTSFQVPVSFENGPAKIEIVANGIASTTVNVNSRFTNLTMINNWTTGGEALAASTVTNGIVQLKGTIGQFTGSGGAAFVLPTGSRPSAAVSVPVAMGTTSFGRLMIDTAGNVTVQDETGGISRAQQFTSLDGASFSINTSGFTALTLQNGWTNAPSGTRNAAVKNDNGTIRFEGAVAHGTTATMFTLPSAFRPPSDVYLPLALCNGRKGRLHITTAGVTTVAVAGGDFTQAQCFTSLEGATFALSASGYTAVTPLNGWTNAPSATRNLAYKVDDGIFRMQGAIANGNVGVFMFLPPNLRPVTDLVAHLDLCNGAVGTIFVSRFKGAVEVDAENGFSDAQCFTSLEGVSLSFGQ